MPPRKRLGQLLTELGVIDEHQLQSALGHQKQWGGKLGAVLVQKGFCKEPDVVSALSRHLGMPSVKLAEAKIDARAVKLVSRQIADKLHVFPYDISGSGRSEVVTIAMSDPTDLSAVDQLAFHTGRRIKPMLAGDSEIVSAIQAHYGEEKKPAAQGPSAAPARVPTPAPPPAAQPAPAQADFPKRVAPPPPAGGGLLTPAGGTPYIPPPIPKAASRPAQKLDEIEPDESMAVPAPAAPLDLPQDDGQEMPLEPIAAHSQFGDQVAGREEVEGSGNASDSVDGLVSASVAHAGAEAAQMEGLEPVAAHSQEPGAESEWGAEATAGDAWTAEPVPPAVPEGAGWGDEPVSSAVAAPQEWIAAEGHGEGWDAPSRPAAEEELPIDAIMGDAQQQDAEAPDAWASSEDPLAAGGEAAWSSPSASEPVVESEAPAESAQPAGDSGPGDAAMGESPSFEAEAAAAEAGIAFDSSPDDDNDDSFEIVADPPAEAAPGSEGEALLDSPPEPPPDGVSLHPASPSTDKFALAAAETAQQPASVEAEPASQRSDAPAEPAETDSNLEGWVAPTVAEPQGAGWFGEGLVGDAPLSAADVGTLASVGIEPNDAAAALRLLAALVRVLNRRQLLDLDEVSVELYESRAQAAQERAAAEAEANGVPQSGEPTPSHEAQPEPAET